MVRAVKSIRVFPVLAFQKCRARFASGLTSQVIFAIRRSSCAVCCSSGRAIRALASKSLTFDKYRGLSRATIVPVDATSSFLLFRLACISETDAHHVLAKFSMLSVNHPAFESSALASHRMDCRL